MPKLNKTARILWILFVAALFAWTSSTYHREADIGFRGEILLRHGLLMLAVSMPSGWVLMFMLGYIAGWLGVNTSGIGGAFFVTIASGIAGYTQWFLLLPWMWRKRVGRVSVT